MSEIGRERKKIMIVDDTKDTVWTMKKMLESAGFETMESYGGIECLQKLYEVKKKPDLVLLDIMMEPMDGWVTHPPTPSFLHINLFHHPIAPCNP